MLREVFAGIDLGGSKARFGFFDRYCNRILNDAVVEHNGGELTNEGLADELTDGISRLWERLDKLDNINKNGLFSYMLGAIGLGSPGPLDPNKGIIENPPNLPQIKNLQIADILQKKFGVPAFLLNDADAAVVGEHAFGAGKGFQDIVMLTLGAGIGSGVIAGGKLQRGMGRGGEWGHTTMAIPEESKPGFGTCACGRTGCIEAYIGTVGLREIAADCWYYEHRGYNRQSKYNDQAVVGHLMWKAEEVAPNIAQGIREEPQSCALCVDILDRYAEYLSLAIGNIVCVHNPECVILGGGIANIGQPLMDAVNGRLKNKQDKMSGLLNGLQIKFAQLTDAGVVGAAKYAANMKLAEFHRIPGEYGLPA